MNIELRIKSKSLSEEQRIIRHEEARLKRLIARKTKSQDFLKATREKIYLHRTKDVRPEARATFISRAFLQGQDYVCLEQIRYTQPDWERVRQMVKKYGRDDPRITLQKLEDWIDTARGTSLAIRIPKPKKQVEEEQVSE